VTKRGVKLFHRGGPYNPSLMNTLPSGSLDYFLVNSIHLILD